MTMIYDIKQDWMLWILSFIQRQVQSFEELQWSGVSHLACNGMPG